MVRLHGGELRHMRWRDYSMVMQSAMNALNPMKSIGAQFKDALEAHGTQSREETQTRSREVLELVGIDSVHLGSYPHQLSGGMRQRAMIAMALLFTPQLVIMDEPTSALDVVAQQSLMTKIRELQQRLGFAVVFVTHDMSVVSRYSDRVIVMYAGQIAESAPTQAIFERPLHPYSRGLMNAFPSIRGPRREMAGIPGSPPDLARPPSGCRFHPRCPDVMEICPLREPELYPRDGAQVRCLLYAEPSEPAAEPAQETQSS
jgi:peptide/nickel transport system ATP-binding protein